MLSFLLLVIAGAQANPGAPARDSRVVPAAAAISGRITEHDSGRPLPRIVVTLVTPDRSKQIEAITNAEGRYEITELEPGAYTISAAPDEHRSTHLRQWYGETSPASFSAGPMRPNIELKPAEVRSGVDIALWRALAIEGRVSDPWDEPMAEVEVAVSRADGRIHAARPAYSDDHGVYRVYGLAPGRYRVCANAREQPVPSERDGPMLARTCHPASVAEAAASDVVLTSQDASGIDIRVQRVGSYSISGSVIDASGTPVDGAHVNAYSLDEPGISAYATSRGGEFLLTGVTPGRYFVTASIGGSRSGDPNPPRRELEVGYASADVSGIDTTGVTVTLSKPARAAGRVIFAENPAPRADRLRMVVRTRPSEDRSFFRSQEYPFSSVNDDLTFDLTGLYRLPLLVGLHGLPEGWVLQSVRYEGRDITYIPTDFGSGSSQGRLEIVATSRVAHPSVRAVDEHGAVVSSFYLVAAPADPSRRKLGLTATPGNAAPDGVLKLGAILPGEYLFAALPMHDYLVLIRDPTRIEGFASVATRVTLSEHDARTFELRLTNLPAR